ncbi:putative AAA+ ATPase domain, P-loop containing nucleoside triphosphate hydrolase [Helianthus annuus]|nr:putative AAA+ ATPase domain, P-loop containing nucleoside triphosphate hydrolase [Helianthus annuus]
MEFVSPIVESLKKHLGFLVYSTEYVEDMKKKLDQLNHIEKDIQENGSESHRKRKWLEDVKDLNERSNFMEAPSFFNVAKRYKLGKQSYGILEEIKDLEDRESKIVLTHAQKCLAEVGSTSTGASTSAPVLMGTQNNFKSRDSIYKAALESLNDESHKMIALCGMGGVGKTTMMEQLKKDVEASKSFDRVVKVVLGENTDVIALQRAIAKYIDSEDLKEDTRDARADRLQKIFEEMSKQGKKTLVIMDDIWSEVDLKDVGLSPLPNGFKLLFTSRFENVCARMGVKTDSVFKIRVLDEEEAKTLFFGIVGPSMLDGDEPELQKIGEDIVNKCGGLPIALKTIAKSLIGNIKEAWQETLSNLQHEDLNDIMHKVFEMSYNNLKEEDDQSIFLLCGLFPDDFDIPVEDLVRYGWGLKLFTKVHTLAAARRRTIICVNNLIRANLLTESERMGCVKMHDLVRVFALGNFSKVKQASIVCHDNMSGQPLIKDAKESYDRVLLKCTGISKFPVDFSYPNLSLLIVMDGKNLLKFPQDIYENSEKLEVVCYENIGIPLLPVVFEHSTKLRTLCLRSCSLIEDISFLGSLSNLEALSLVDCGIRRLPLMIGMLKKLKLLDLTGGVDLRIDDGVFQKLCSLEELYMRAYKNRPVTFTDANCDELEILSKKLFALELELFKSDTQPKNMSFEKLERFRISIGCQLDKLKDNEIYSFRNTIKLVGECNELVECKISYLFEKTEELRLQVNDMNHLENVSMHHSFSNLKFLHVSYCKELTYLFTVAMASGLKKLERLEISDCPVLRTLVGEDCTVGVIRFPKLNYLSLVYLPSMVSLCETVIELPEMVELNLDDLPNFTSIYPDKGNPCAIESLLNKKVVIPKLEKLSIFRMENLKQIWPCEISTDEKNNVSGLRTIIVEWCDKLINIFPNNPLPTLNNLEELEVDWCDSVEVIFNINFENVSEMEGYISRLRSIDVRHSENLKELWRMRGLNNSNILINGFQAVQTIYISDCKRFESIFTPVTANFDLSALTSLNKIDVMSEVDDYIPDVTYPSYLLHTCQHLQCLDLKGDERVGEVVFDMDSQSGRELATIQPPLLLPYLQSIHLYSLKKMSHVWKCNWNKFLIRHHPPLRFPFQNLTDITLCGCPVIKYLLSPLMAKYLSNLKSVKIYWCHGMEEVISRRDDDITTSTSASSYQDTAFFPHLDTLELTFMPSLKSVDDGGRTCGSDKLSFNMIHDEFQSGQVIGGACWSLCQYPTKISIWSCDALSSLIPWYAVGQMKRLQELKINYCNRMMEVFESESSNNNVDEGGARVVGGPPLKNIGLPQLSNLKTVHIKECDLLSYLFTFSTLESLKQLKELTVIGCKAMQVIVKEEKETSSKGAVFPRLETLILDKLPKLKGFFLGMNDFRWPSLVIVKINECPQLMMFTSGQSTTPKLKYLQTNFGKYSPECGLNFHETIYQTTFPASSESTISKGMPSSFNNLIEINIVNKEDVGRTIIPSNELQQLVKLQQITICGSCGGLQEVFEIGGSCGGLQEVFEVVAVEGSGSSESKTLVPIPNLTQVKLEHLDDLKYLWKSNQWMVLEFPNLTTVHIHRCYKLEHVFTCSMVGSLVQLQELHISRCSHVEVIVKEEEEECDAKVNEVILPHLNSLTLDDLPRLKGFCLGKKPFSLPALDTLQIKDCPAITNFTKGYLSTPELKVIDTSFGFCYVKTDTNSLLKTKQEEGCEF